MTATPTGVSPTPMPCLRTVGLTHHYEADTPALNGVDLVIAENAYLAIIGQNGSGKTTLVKHFNGLLKPTAGRVWVFDEDTAAVTMAHLARQVGYVFQNPDHQIFCPSVREEIAFGLRNIGCAEDEIRARTAETLAAFALVPYAELPPAVLGYGLRRLVSVAAVYAMRPPVLILDEPTAGLDWRSAQELMRRVDTLHAEGHTILLVSHDMRLVAAHSRETLVMHEGRVLLRDTTPAIMARAEELRRAMITPPQITQLAQRLGRWGMPPDVLSVSDFCRHYARRRGEEADDERGL
jgi:energy-coupling factor transporter ATP-binding protein EcfA2